MTPTDDPMEPARTLNGKALTLGQALTLRVALESFASELMTRGLGEDDYGRAMTTGYLTRIDELRTIMYSKKG